MSKSLLNTLDIFFFFYSFVCSDVFGCFYCWGFFFFCSQYTEDFVRTVASREYHDKLSCCVFSKVQVNSIKTNGDILKERSCYITTAIKVFAVVKMFFSWASVQQTEIMYSNFLVSFCLLLVSIACALVVLLPQ